ncbi:MAG: hypothetical protein IPP35_02625 [Elusimicrobia bacterium]|nr:hypothetical protein [Elusimicrobiota bacterium]
MNRFKELCAPRGQIMILAVGIVLVLAILTPLMVHLVQRESAWSVKSVRQLKTSSLAQAALQKAEWRMSTSTEFYAQASSGTVIPGYNNDQVFTDIDEGEYKVRLTTGPLADQFTMLVTARDKSTNEVQGIQAVYWNSGVQGAFYNNGTCNVNSDMIVHWAPVRRKGTMNVSSASPYGARHFPRKISDSQISVVPGTIYNKLNPTDNVEFWILPTSVGPDPVPDFNYYKDKAMKSVVPTRTANGKMFATINGIAEANPVGSGLFLKSRNLGFTTVGAYFGVNYQFQDPSAVLLFENDMTGAQTTVNAPIVFSSYTFIDVEAVINRWNGANSRLSISSLGAGVVQATIPASANLEYQHPTAQTVWTAGGVNSMQVKWMNPTRCCYPIGNVSVRAFMYSAAGFDVISGRPVVVGAMSSPSYVGAPAGAHGPTIYFDEARMKNVRINNTATRISGKEISVQW